MLWFVFYFFYLLSAPIVYADVHRFVREEYYVFALLWALVFALICYILKSWRPIFAFSAVILGFISMLDLGHIFLYQGRISRHTFFVILDTNSKEAFDFIFEQTSWQLASLLGAFALISFGIGRVLFHRLRAAQIIHLSRWIAGGVVLPAMLHFSIKLAAKESPWEAYRNSLPPWYLTEQYFEYSEEQKELSAYFNDLNHLPPAKVKNSSALKRKHILIFGESATRLRMGMYGYFRDNTPHLSALKNELVVFENAWATNPPATYWNLKKINTFLDRNSPRYEEPRYSLVQMMKAAGFSTAWISNQLATGVNSNYTSAMALSADYHLMVNLTGGASFDEKLLQPLDEYLSEKSESTFIVIHLQGSHIVYSERYPKSFKRFVDFSDIPFRSYHNDFKKVRYNDYDNSILYTDYVLSEVIKIAKQHRVDSFIYISDHGEETFINGDYSGHPAEKDNPNLFAIPFIMYLNPKTYMQQKTLLKLRVKDVVSSDDLIHTLLDLYEVEMPEYKKEKSLLQKSYIQPKPPI